MEVALSSKPSPLMFLGFWAVSFLLGVWGGSSARGAASLRSSLRAPTRPRAARAGVVPTFLPQFRFRWRVRLAGGGGCPPPPLWSRWSRGGGWHPRTAPHSPAQPPAQPRTAPRTAPHSLAHSPTQPRTQPHTTPPLATSHNIFFRRLWGFFLWTKKIVVSLPRHLVHFFY